MKISASGLEFNYQQNKNQTSAQVSNSSVRVISSNGNTQGTSASILQSQQQTLRDTISSYGVSHVSDSQGNQSIIESAEFIESITQLNISEGITVRRVGAMNDQAAGLVSEVQVSRMMAFQSNTDIQLQAIGKVFTEDGREIDFMLELNYQREIEVQQSSVFVGNRDLIDPLVINLNGGAAALSDSYFEFDLNNDGQTESLHQTAGGTGFLAFDKNNNGKIDNGSELFGPNTGSGFGELREYDDDGNGWIDENDAIFTQLSFMDFDENGEQRLRDISDVGLGAIALTSREMDFDLYDSTGNFQAQVARSGVALSEDGQVLAVQEIYYPGQAFGQGRLERIESIEISEANEIVPVISPLTQFQFEDAVTSARIAETHVTLDLPTYSNRMGESTFHEIDENFVMYATTVAPAASQSASSNTQAFTTTQTTGRHSTQTTSSQTIATELEKRMAIQAEFQFRIETEYKNIQQTVSGSDQTITNQSIEVASQDQSIFWEYNGIQLTHTNEDSKISELKHLIEDLKSMREQQEKSREKIGLYIQVGQAE